MAKVEVKFTTKKLQHTITLYQCGSTLAWFQYKEMRKNTRHNEKEFGSNQTRT